LHDRSAFIISACADETSRRQRHTKQGKLSFISNLPTELVLFSIRPVDVKRFSAFTPLAGLMFLAGPRFSSDEPLELSHHGIRERGGPI
jgi:hypothetical protein